MSPEQLFQIGSLVVGTICTIIGLVGIFSKKYAEDLGKKAHGTFVKKKYFSIQLVVLGIGLIALFFYSLFR